jgi:F-type H+-transporting ATPase subunit delta
MPDLRVARRYARALFNTALKLDVVKSVEEDLGGIQSLLEGDERFRHFLLSPRVARDEKLRIADKLFSDRVTALTMQAIRLLLEKRREDHLSMVYRQFVELRRRHANMIFATVTSSEELSHAQRENIVAKISQSTGKSVEPSFIVEPAVLGGVKVQYENTVLDGTVRGTLTKLHDRLKYDVLKQN